MENLMECFAPFSPPLLWLQGFGWGFMKRALAKMMVPGQIAQQHDGLAAQSPFWRKPELRYIGLTGSHP